MTGTGLKKWRPPNLSFLSVTLAISVIDKEEVFEAKIVDLHTKYQQEYNTLHVLSTNNISTLRLNKGEESVKLCIALCIK